MNDRNPKPGGSNPPRRRRRTQQERSAETRALLLDVTIECLAELGYSGATAQVIAERAGLTRGAQLHHFGSKAQLVTAAMEHLFERRIEEFRRGAGALANQSEFTAGVLELLWQMVSGPAGYAYLELAIAARTDAELREAMIALTRRMDEQVDVAFAEQFQAPSDADGFFELAITAVFALMEGLAIERIVRPQDDRLDRVLALLKQMAPLAMAPRG